MAQLTRPRFGKLLTEAISSVARRKRTNMEIIEEDLALKISEVEGRAKPLTFYTIQRWMRGYLPDCQRIQLIVDFCVRQGRIPRDLAEGLLRQADCEHLLPMLDKLFSPSVEAAPKRVYTNLPRRNPGFLGRETEMLELLKRLAPESRAAVLVLYGLGGIGKTTLAIETGHACLPNGDAILSTPYEAVIFTSAHGWVLTLTDVLDEIGRVLEYPAVLRQASNEKMPLVQDLLRRFQVLLIIDNFETITDPDLTRFALEGVPVPSKVIITTRDYHPTLWPGTWPIQLKGLTDAKALQLVREWSQEHELAAVLAASDTELETLLRTTEGNPYGLLTALGLIAHQKQPLATLLRDLWEGRGQIFDYIFDRVWVLLDESERRILMAMPYFVDSASREAIGATVRLEGYLLSKALGRLAELSLLMTDDEPEESLRRYRVHPLTRNFTTGKLTEAPEVEDQARARWQNYYLQFADRCLTQEGPRERYWSSLASGHSLTLIDPEWPNLLNVLVWVNQKRDDRSLVDLVILLVHYMDRRGLFTERLDYVSKAAEAARRLGQQADEAWFRIDGLAWTLIEEGSFTDAIQEIIKGSQIAQKIEVKNAVINDQIALGHAFLARALLLQGDLAEVSVLLDKALSISCGPFVWSRINIIAGELAHKKQDFLEAIRFYKNALTAIQQYRGDEEDSEVRHRLGFSYLAAGQLVQAEAEFTKVLDKKLGITTETIPAKFGLAHTAKARGGMDKARQLAEEAEEELLRLHVNHRLRSDIDEFLRGLSGAETE